MKTIVNNIYLITGVFFLIFGIGMGLEIALWGEKIFAVKTMLVSSILFIILLVGHTAD